jgi:phage terminase Nu1 subunit (DNA packaging protein)
MANPEKRPTKYEEWEADKPYMSLKQLCAMFNVSSQGVLNWEAEGLPGGFKPNAVRKCFYVMEAIPWIINRLHGDKEDSRERLRRLKADAAELDLKIRTGEILEASDVQEEWSSQLSMFRSKMLSVPSKASGFINPTMNEAQVAEIIKREIYEALESLSGNIEDAVELDEHPLSAEPLVIPERKKVGRPPKVKSQRLIKTP